MRILMLNYEFPPLGGGASPVTYNLCKWLVKKGHEVDVVTMGYKDLPNFEIVDGINVYRVKCLRSKKEICYTYEMLSYIIFALPKVLHMTKKKKYDLVHVHFIIPTGILAYLLKRYRGLDYVITSHGSDVLGYNKRFSIGYKILKLPWRKIVKNSKLIVTASKFLQQKIKENIKDFRNYEIINNGIEIGSISPKKKEQKILLVSRLFVNKGIQDFIYAIKDIDLAGWEINIVGDGPYRVELEKIAQNSKTKINFLGWLGNNSEEYKDLYAKSAIFVMPSYFENFSFVLLEAMSAGCSIIATDVGGNTEIAKGSALYFKPGDKEKLKKNLLRLKQDFKLRKKMANKAIQCARALNYDVISQKYIEVYKK